MLYLSLKTAIYNSHTHCPIQHIKQQATDAILTQPSTTALVYFIGRLATMP